MQVITINRWACQRRTSAAYPLVQAEPQRRATRARLAVRGTFSPSGPARHAAGAGLTRTLGSANGRMHCRRCSRRPSAPVKGSFAAETASIICASWPPDELKKMLSASAALTSFGVRGAICGGRLFELKANAISRRFHIPRPQRLHRVNVQGCCSTERATSSLPTSSGLQRPMQSASRKPVLWPAAAHLRYGTVRRAEPNPSLKRSANGRPPGPVWR